MTGLTLQTLLFARCAQVRLQGQRKNGAPVPVCVQNCSHFQLHTGLMDVWCRKCDHAPRPRPTLKPAAAPTHYTGPIDTAVKMVRNEGAFSLWRGLGPTLVCGTVACLRSELQCPKQVLSVPSTVVYFNFYDVLKDKFDRAGVPLSPLFAGACSLQYALSFGFHRFARCALQGRLRARSRRRWSRRSS